MILGPQQYALVGAQGTALVTYKLRRFGINAMEVGEGLPFDVLAFSDNRIIRIQAKATQAAHNGVFQWLTAKGRYATTTKHSASLTEYTEREADLMALVALPIDGVIFKPVFQVGNKIRLPASVFEDEDISRRSFDEAVGEVFGE